MASWTEPGGLRVVPLALLLITCTMRLTLGASNPCPNVTKAARHYDLRVSQRSIPLPGGKNLSGLLYNDSYIGPIIRVPLGEELSVDMYNEADVATSIHWHGQSLMNSSWADGVAGVSQDPTPPGRMFRYKFKAAPAGTFWYHSHTGSQFGDGLRGPLIVEDPNDPYRSAYDEEIVILVTDQLNTPAEEELQALKKSGMMDPEGIDLCRNVSQQDWSDQQYYTVLVNGKGYIYNNATGKAEGEPAVFKVQQGKRYRIRTIQGSASWGLKVTADSHGMDLIAVDGINVQKTPARGYVFTPGERVDFILTADQPVGNYWLNVATLIGLGSPAVLSYEGAPDPMTDPKLANPPVRLGCSWVLPQQDVIDFKNQTLRPYKDVPDPPAIATQAHVVYLSRNFDPAESSQAKFFGTTNTTNTTIYGSSSAVKGLDGCPTLANGKASQYCWTLNWVPFQYATKPLLFPSAQTGPQTYVETAPLGAVVDVAFINPYGMVHPMHLHGTSFWVLGTGNGQILKPDGTIDYSQLNTTRPMYRDTQPVPNAVPRGASSGSPDMSGSSAMSPNAMNVTPDLSGMASPSPMASMGSGSAMGRRLLQQPAPGAAMEGSMMGPTAPSATMASKEPMAQAAPAKSAGGMGGMLAQVDLVLGYTVIRFTADNPGVWALHCHIDLHANSGMFMAFRVPGPDSASPWELPSGVTTCNAGSSMATSG